MNDQPSTVLFLVDRWVAGGVMKHISDLCESFSSAGLECIVAAWLAPGEKTPANATFHNLPLFTQKNTKSFSGFWQSVTRLRNLLKSRRIDVIHMHNRYVTLLAAIASRGGSRGRVYTVHSMFSNLRFLPWYPRQVICLNEVGKRAFLRNRFLPRGLEITIIPNGIEIDPDEMRKTRQTQVPTFTCIGRLEKLKGVDLLIRAVAELRDTAVHILIVGTGPEEKALRNLSKTLGLDARIKFMGFMDDPKEILDESIALIMPATGLEGFGYVVIEAFARHRPVIASDLATFDETVLDGVTGIRFINNNHLSLANTIGTAMKETEDMNAMGDNGFSLACEKFTLRQMVEATLEVYDSSTRTDIP